MYTHIIYTHIIRYYSTLKKKIMLFVTTWVNLEDIMLSEISQVQKDKYHMILYVESKKIVALTINK